MYKNPETDEEEVEEAKIPLVSVNRESKKIMFGSDWYELIMCYLCPFDNIPIYAYWKITEKKKTNKGIVGRALRDSGFGGYKFFQTKDGHGYEYDVNNDPKKRHQHQKYDERFYNNRVIELWNLYTKLNPQYSVNKLIHKLLGGYSGVYIVNEKWWFITSQEQAMQWIKKMKALNITLFRVLLDICAHGKPIFYFNIAQWLNIFERHYYGDTNKKKKEQIIEWFGEDLVKALNIPNQEED